MNEGLGGFQPAGGSGSGFDPLLHLPGLVLAIDDRKQWQDSARTTPAVTNSDPVGGETDLSGNSNHPAQATSGNRPVLVAPARNGRVGVQYDGSAHYLETPAIGFGPDLTVFAVFRAASPANPAAVASAMEGHAWDILFEGPTIVDFRGYDPVAGAAFSTGGRFTNVIPGETIILCGHITGGGTTLSINVNGCAIASGTFPHAQIAQTSKIRLGMRSTGDWQYNGELLALYACSGDASAYTTQFLRWAGRRWDVWRVVGYGDSIIAGQGTVAPPNDFTTVMCSQLASAGHDYANLDKGESGHTIQQLISDYPTFVRPFVGTRTIVPLLEWVNEANTYLAETPADIAAQMDILARLILADGGIPLVIEPFSGRAPARAAWETTERQQVYAPLLALAAGEYTIVRTNATNLGPVGACDDNGAGRPYQDSIHPGVTAQQWLIDAVKPAVLTAAGVV